MKKLLFISAYNVPFVEQDKKFLASRYKVQRSWGAGKKKNLINYLLILFVTGWQVYKSDLVYCWFADFRARCAIWWAQFLEKKSVVVIGGYEARGLMRICSCQETEKISKHLIFCLNNAHLIITISDSYYDTIRAAFNDLPGRIVYIPNGVDFPDKAIDTGKENIILTVCLGSQIQRINTKGLDLFLAAAQMIPDYKFVIIGPVNDLKEEINNSIQSDNVILIDELKTDELAGWYKKSRVYCQFSRFESFGIALVEAMGYGCIPVVAPIQVLTQKTGKFGFVLADYSAEAATKAIFEALNADEMSGMDISKWAKEHFSAQKRKQLLLQEMQKLG